MEDETHRGPVEAEQGMRFTWRWFENGCAVWDAESELGGTLEPVCRCSAVAQASAIVEALNTMAGVR